MSSEPGLDGSGVMDGDRAVVRPDGSAAAEISRAIVQLMARSAGRGPTKARTRSTPVTRSSSWRTR